MEVSIVSHLIGRYKLINHGTYEENGDYKPTSAFLSGELICSSEGFLSVLIFIKDDPEANKEFLAYSGRFEIKSINGTTGVVVHHINICSRSKRNGTSENRIYKFVENNLFLTCDLEDGKIFEARWERVNLNK
jgi:hypothetical protein